MNLNPGSNVMAQHFPDDSDFIVFNNMYSFLCSKLTHFQMNRSATFCWYLIERAKANNVFPQALNYMKQVLSVRFSATNLPALILELISRNEGMSPHILVWQKKVEQAFQTQYKPQDSMTQKWFHCRVELLRLAERLASERKQTEEHDKKRKERMDAWRINARKKLAATGKASKLNRNRSSIVWSRRTPFRDSQELINVKVAAFADIFLTTKALFFFEDDSAHYTHAELVVENALGFLAYETDKDLSDPIDKRLRRCLDEYTYWLMEARKRFSPYDISFVLPQGGLASMYQKTFEETRLRCIHEENRKVFPFAKIGVKRPLELHATHSWKEHGPVRCTAVLAYESFLVLLVVFRIVQEQVYKKNLSIHNKCEIPPRLQLPTPDVVEIPEILFGIEEYQVLTAVRANRKNGTAESIEANLQENTLPGSPTNNEENGNDDDEEENEGQLLITTNPRTPERTDQDSERQEMKATVTPQSLRRAFRGRSKVQNLRDIKEKVTNNMEEAEQSGLTLTIANNRKSTSSPNDLSNPLLAELANNPSFDSHGGLNQMPDISDIFGAQTMSEYAAQLFGEDVPVVQNVAGSNPNAEQNLNFGRDVVNFFDENISALHLNSTAGLNGGITETLPLDVPDLAPAELGENNGDGSFQAWTGNAMQEPEEDFTMNSRATARDWDGV